MRQKVPWLLLFLFLLLVGTTTATDDWGQLLSVAVADVSSLSQLQAFNPLSQQWLTIYDLTDPDSTAAVSLATAVDTINNVVTFRNLLGQANWPVTYTFYATYTNLPTMIALDGEDITVQPCPYAVTPSTGLCDIGGNFMASGAAVCGDNTWRILPFAIMLPLSLLCVVALIYWRDYLEHMLPKPYRTAMLLGAGVFVLYGLVCASVTLAYSCPPPAPLTFSAGFSGYSEAVTVDSALTSIQNVTNSIQQNILQLQLASLSVSNEFSDLSTSLLQANSTALSASRQLYSQIQLFSNSTATYQQYQESERQLLNDILLWSGTWNSAASSVALVDQQLLDAVMVINDGMASTLSATQAIMPLVYAAQGALLCDCASAIGGRCYGNNQCVCNAGWYGARCDQACTCASAAGGYCDSTSPVCICNFGYFGPTCNEHTECASSTAYVPGQTACNQTVPCPLGFVGEFCNVTVTCVHGSVMPRLPTDLPTCVSCLPGWLGANCDQPSACVHGVPSLTDAGCDPTQPCSRGYVGVDCDTLVTCVNGLTMPSYPLNATTCDGLCSAGWYGANCDQPYLCAQGTQLANAPQCDPAYPCQSGFIGPYCNVTVSCVNGVKPATTTDVDVHCVATQPCQAGWGGVDCDQMVTCQPLLQTPLLPTASLSCPAGTCNNGLNGPNCDQSCQCAHGTCASTTDLQSASTCVACETGYTGLPTCSVLVTCTNTTLFGLNTTSGECLSCGSSDYAMPNCNTCPPGLYDYPTCTSACSAVPFADPTGCYCLYGGTFPDSCWPPCAPFPHDPVTGNCTYQAVGPQWSMQGLCSIYNSTTWVMGTKGVSQWAYQSFINTTATPSSTNFWNGYANLANLNPNNTAAEYRSTANTQTLQVVSSGAPGWPAAGTIITSLSINMTSINYCQASVSSTSTGYAIDCQNSNYASVMDGPVVFDVNAVACALGLVPTSATSWVNAGVSQALGVRWAPTTPPGLFMYYPYNTGPFPVQTANYATNAYTNANTQVCQPWTMGNYQTVNGGGTGGVLFPNNFCQTSINSGCTYETNVDNGSSYTTGYDCPVYQCPMGPFESNDLSRNALPPAPLLDSALVNQDVIFGIGRYITDTYFQTANSNPTGPWFPMIVGSKQTPVNVAPTCWQTVNPASYTCFVSTYSTVWEYVCGNPWTNPSTFTPSNAIWPNMGYNQSWNCWAPAFWADGFTASGTSTSFANMSAVPSLTSNGWGSPTYNTNPYLTMAAVEGMSEFFGIPSATSTCPTNSSPIFT